jgi:anti-sigma-K factor RskA
MELHKHPELLDRLAAAYALGSLRGGARRRFEALAREYAPVRAAALLWQARLSGLAELAPSVQPSPLVWTRIDNLVQAQLDAQAMAARRDQATQQAAPSGWWASLRLWRAATLAGSLAAVLALVNTLQVRDQAGSEVAALQARLLATEQVKYVAVLQDDKAKAAMLVTFDPRANKLTLQRVGGFQEAADRSLQLWALPPGHAPRSLGVLDKNPLVKLTAADRDVDQVPTLAISVEPKGGVPSEGGPTGPVVFTGTLIKKQL